jgi:hypothetical protein
MPKRYVTERYYEKTTIEHWYQKPGFWGSVAAIVVGGLLLIVPDWAGRRWLDDIFTSPETTDAAIATVPSASSPGLQPSVVAVTGNSGEWSLVHSPLLVASPLEAIATSENSILIGGSRVNTGARAGFLASIAKTSDHFEIAGVEEVTDSEFVFDLASTQSGFLVGGKSSTGWGLWQVDPAPAPLVADIDAVEPDCTPPSWVDITIHGVGAAGDDLIAVGRTSNWLDSSELVVSVFDPVSQRWCAEPGVPWTGEAAIGRSVVEHDGRAVVVGGVATRQAEPSEVLRTVWTSGVEQWTKPEPVGGSSHSRSELLGVASHEGRLWVSGRAVRGERIGLWYVDGSSWIEEPLPVTESTAAYAVDGLLSTESGLFAFGYVCSDSDCARGTEAATVWSQDGSGQWTLMSLPEGEGARALDAAMAMDGMLVVVGDMLRGDVVDGMVWVLEA